MSMSRWNPLYSYLLNLIMTCLDAHSRGFVLGTAVINTHTPAYRSLIDGGVTSSGSTPGPATEAALLAHAEGDPACKGSALPGGDLKNKHRVTQRT